MPLYQFRCTKCSKVIEIQQSMDAAAPLCFEELCNGQETEKLISKSSVIFKGSGWAKDGYSK